MSGPEFVPETCTFFLTVRLGRSGYWCYWSLESRHFNALFTSDFLSLSCLTATTFLPDTSSLFSHLREIALDGHYESNIHCSDLQKMLFDYSIHFCTAISHHHFLPLLP